MTCELDRPPSIICGRRFLIVKNIEIIILGKRTKKRMNSCQETISVRKRYILQKILDKVIISLDIVGIFYVESISQFFLGIVYFLNPFKKLDELYNINI